MLEKRINIRAADYRFSDKIKYNQGFSDSRNQFKEGTRDKELIGLTSLIDFKEADIVKRNLDIIENFIEYLYENNLIK